MVTGIGATFMEIVQLFGRTRDNEEKKKIGKGDVL